MDSTERIEAFRRLFGGDPSEATDADVQVLFGKLALSGEESMELDPEIEERLNAFFDDPTGFIELQTDEEVRKKLRTLGASNRELFPSLQHRVPIQGQSLPDPFADHVPEEPEAEPPRPRREPQVLRTRVPEAEPPRPRESEEPEEERIPEIVEIYLRSIEHAYPCLKRARTRDEWPEMRAVIEREENLLRFSSSVRTWAAARSVHTDVVDAADAYVTAMLGGFSHPSFTPAAYKSAWRLAVGHPYDEP